MSPTAADAAREWIILHLKDGDMENDDYITVSGLSRVTLAERLTALLTARESAARVEEREACAQCADRVVGSGPLPKGRLGNMRVGTTIAAAGIAQAIRARSAP